MNIEAEIIAEIGERTDQYLVADEIQQDQEAQKRRTSAQRAKIAYTVVGRNKAQSVYIGDTAFIGVLLKFKYGIAHTSHLDSALVYHGPKQILMRFCKQFITVG